VIKSRRVRWVDGALSSYGEEDMCRALWRKNPEGKRFLEDLDVDVRIILK